MNTLPTTIFLLFGDHLGLGLARSGTYRRIPRKIGEIPEMEVPDGLYLGSICTRMDPNRSESEAYDGTDVFGASWEDLGGVGWISENRKIHREQNRKTH